MNIEAMKTKKDLYKLGVLALIQQVGGLTKAIEQVNEAQKTGGITKKQALDLRNAIREAGNLKENIVIPNEAITELDEKLKRAIKFNLSY